MRTVVGAERVGEVRRARLRGILLRDAQRATLDDRPLV
jgi:hypothetical protein